MRREHLHNLITESLNCTILRAVTVRDTVVFFILSNVCSGNFGVIVAKRREPNLSDSYELEPPLLFKATAREAHRRFNKCIETACPLGAKGSLIISPFVVGLVLAHGIIGTLLAYWYFS